MSELELEFDEPSENDDLARAPLVQRVADLILNYHKSKPLVVGVYAPWGDGKTTFLRLLERQLKTLESTKILTSWFSPWMFAGQERLTWEFFEVLSDSVSKEAGFEGLGKSLLDFARRLQPLREFGTVRKAAAVMDTIISIQEPSSARELYKKIEIRMGQLGKKLIVFIDDIDRLDKDEIFEVIKLVKSTATFSSIIYILAFDDRIVSSAIETRFHKSQDDGSRFLEKIVQIPVVLPRPNRRRLTDNLFNKIDEVIRTSGIKLSTEDERELGSRIGRGADAVIGNIRDINRFINSLCFSLPIVKDEVHPGEFIILEMMRSFALTAYRRIRENERALENLVK